MIIISNKEFCENQSLYFDKVDKGEQLIIQRGKGEFYALTPSDEKDLYFNAKMVERIKHSVEQAKNGAYTELNSSQDIKDLLGL